MQNCVSFTNHCINLLAPLSITCKYRPKVLELLHLLQCIAAHFAAYTALGFRKTFSTSLFLVLIFILAQLHSAENQSSVC